MDARTRFASDRLFCFYGMQSKQCLLGWTVGVVLSLSPLLVSLAAGADSAKQLFQRAYEISRQDDSDAGYDRVLKLCQQGLKLGPSPEVAKYARRLMAWARTEKGEVLAKEDKSSASLEQFEKAIRLDPNCWRALHNLAVAKAVVGDYEGAIKDLNRVLELEQQYTNAWFNRAEVNLALHRYEKALSDYEHALKLAPGDLNSQVGRARALHGLGQTSQALAHLQRVIKIAPKNAGVYVERADVYLALGSYEQAALDYRRAIAFDRKLARAYEGAAWLMATCPDPRFRDKRLAVEAAEKALELQDEPSLSALETLAAAYASAGKFGVAVKTQRKAIAMSHENGNSSLEEQLGLYKSQKVYRIPAAHAGVLQAGYTSELPTSEGRKNGNRAADPKRLGRTSRSAR